MTACAFDTLLIALHDAVVHANDILRAQRQALLAGEGPVGDINEHTLSVAIPQGDPAAGAVVIETLPLRLFRDKRIPHIAMMSIEFDCTLRYLRQRGRPSSELYMVIGKPRFAWFWRRRIHRVRISYLSANAWHPRVEIDDRLLLPASPTPAAGD